MKAQLFGMDGKAGREIQLPKVFDEHVRPELIRRAVLHEQSKTRQPKGAFKLAGLQTTAEYMGRKESWRAIKNKGISRLPREKIPKGKFGRVRIVPFSVKGRRAHPPNPKKKLVELMNRKEYQFALRSAIAATANKELVKARGHLVNGLNVPLVLDGKFEDLKKAKEVAILLEKLGLGAEIERSRDSRKRVSGVIANRRGGTRTRRSVLVVAGENKPVLRAARNLPGVDVRTAKSLDVSALAPGGHPGRLTIWSERAVKELERM